MNDVSPFDYSDVSSNLKQELFDDAEYIRRKQAEARHNVIEAGIRLLAVKEKLPHGAFLPWVETECGMSVSSVDDYLKIAREFGLNSHRGANLPIRAMRALAAPSMPDAAKQEIYDKIDAGETVTTADIEAEKRKALDAIQQAQIAEDKADKAEREKSDLLGRISEISQTAASEAQQQIDDAEQRAATEVASLNARIDALKLEADANQTKIDMAVEAKAKAATDAELAKHEDHIKNSRRKVQETEDKADKLSRYLGRLKGELKELQDRKNRVDGADEEATYFDKDMRAFSKELSVFANTIQGLEHDHEGGLVQQARQLAKNCEGLAQMLRSIEKRTNVIELEAVR